MADQQLPGSRAGLKALFLFGLLPQQAGWQSFLLLASSFMAPMWALALPNNFINSIKLFPLMAFPSMGFSLQSI
jgi:hypothetical protein